jgi:hypothetical protein
LPLSANKRYIKNEPGRLGRGKESARKLIYPFRKMNRIPSNMRSPLVPDIVWIYFAVIDSSSCLKILLEFFRNNAGRDLTKVFVPFEYSEAIGTPPKKIPITNTFDAWANTKAYEF